MLLSEHEITISRRENDTELLDYFSTSLVGQLPSDFLPVRFVVTQTTDTSFLCEVGGICGDEWANWPKPDSIFRFMRRPIENNQEFNAVVLVPTGIGAEIGGHAGDAAPVARMLAPLCDNVILHPNVVNASDINEMPSNALYAEGSVITRLLMGTVGLQPVRKNRVLTIIDAHKDKSFVNAAINAVNGARASFGLCCPEVLCLDPPVKLRARFSASGRAAGRVEEFLGLCQAIEEQRESFDAIAVSSVIDVPHEFHLSYFDAKGDMVNPWGGVEAMLTHALSSIFNLPTAHAPMFESQEIANLDPGIVDPRMAAEAVSLTFLNCVLKGLQRSPRVVTDEQALGLSGVLSAADISCLVIPDGCLGLPTLAALEQGIPVIAVRENKNLMRNNLAALPWAAGQFFCVENYWEAAGVLLAMKAGIEPNSVRRPLDFASVTDYREARESSKPELSNVRERAERL